MIESQDTLLKNLLSEIEQLKLAALRKYFNQLYCFEVKGLLSQVLRSTIPYSQENRPLRHTGDSFRKIIITGDGTRIWRNNDGHTIMNIQDFLLNPDSLDL